MTVRSKDSFHARQTLTVGGRRYAIYSLERLEAAGLAVQRLPYSLKILLENLLRHEDGKAVDADDVKALAGWEPKSVRSERSPSARRACCCRTSPAFPASSIWPPCATP